MDTKPTDRFKDFLAFLLLETGLTTKQGWAQFLGVTELTIERVWLSGYQMPPPEKMYSILDVLWRHNLGEGIQAEIARRLAEIELLPLSQIFELQGQNSKASMRGARSLAEFLAIPLVEGLRNGMSSLTTEQRVRVLSAAMHELRRVEDEISAAANSGRTSAP